MQTAILYPVFAQIFLTLLIGIGAAYARIKTLNAKEVRYADIALDNSKYPVAVRQLSNSYNNQFELPVLFYVLCIVAFLTSLTDFVMVTLAWCFVLSRILHAYIHTTSNRVPRRGMAFFLAAILVGLMALYLFLQLLATSL
jgi:hypothetical protein